MPAPTQSSKPPRSQPTPPAVSNESPRRPSRFYRAGYWTACIHLVQHTPAAIIRALALLAAQLFWWIDRPRRRAVIRNLAPLVHHDPRRATTSARRLYDRFALKLVDLWHYEAGTNIDRLFGQLNGEALFLEAINTRRGVLLVTPHLGNWEFGAPLLARHGIKLLALTLAEPHEPLTEMRRAARARHGVETLVIQQDPFAFLEVIRRLERGEIVALLIDRPPPSVSVTVELCGQPIDISVAPAEIARASGCVILPVYLIQSPSGTYDAFVLPAIEYDRPSLRQPEARRELVQKTISAFEPVICAHPEQWYHLVPVWHPPPPAQPTKAPSP